MHQFLISAPELNKILGDPNLLLVDVRHDLYDPMWGRHIYLRQRIPGAVFLHMDEDLAGPITDTAGRHPLPDAAKFTAVLRRAGLEPSRQVVIYDDIFGGMAVRLWWMLHAVGHTAAAVLDGGYTAWFQQGFATEEGEPAPPAPSDYPAVQGFRGWVEITPENVRDHLLVDSRAPERYAGLQEPLDPVAGHIPGAVNRFWKENLDKDGLFLPADQLREQMQHLRQPVFYCGSGVTSCHNVLAWRYAGLEGERLFPGSWSKWCNNYPDHIETESS
jgi:thiosulfate/3-mercaptopyruvate sulfurtransferase